MPEERQKHWERLKDTENSTPYYQMMGLKIVELGLRRARLTMPVETKHVHSHRFIYMATMMISNGRQQQT